MTPDRPLKFPPDFAPSKPSLKVRFDGHYYICRCGESMMFLDGLEVPQRRMECVNRNCRVHGEIYLEPMLEAFPL